MWSLLAQDPSGVLLQYGVLGALVAIGIPFVWNAYKEQRDRANRLEAELREQNRVIQEKLVTELARATQAIAQLLDRRESDRWRDR